MAYFRSRQFLRRKFHHEPGAALAVEAIFHPHAPTVQAYMFVDKCQPEAGTIVGASAAGGGAAGETLEDAASLLGWHARAAVFDSDPDVSERFTFTVGFGDRHDGFVAAADALRSAR